MSHEPSNPHAQRAGGGSVDAPDRGACLAGTPRVTPVCTGRPSLSVWDGVVFVVAVVVGTGIFKTPSLVAAEAGSVPLAMLAWVAGAVASLLGALCYAELASAYPNVGGDCHFIERAFGAAPAGLLAWSRLLVLQSGSIVMQAFVVGDYASELAHLGPHSPAIYAACVVAVVTLANVMGLRQGRGIQRALTGTLALGLLVILAVGFAGPSAAPMPPAETALKSPSIAGASMAMIFVLLTYGGWNEAVYLSAELEPSRGAGAAPRRSVVRVLLGGLALVTVLYLAVNAAFFRALGLERVAAAEAVGATLMRHALGEQGARALSAVVVVAALSAINATVFTGARTAYALGRSCPPLRFLGSWDAAAGSPRRALLVQGAISLVLVLLGALTRDGFRTMVEYTAPVFWFFLLLGVASLPVLRRKDRQRARPFRVPLYPLSPIAFARVAAAMLYSSVAYAGWGALVGVGVVLAGVPLLVGRRAADPHHSSEGETDETSTARDPRLDAAQLGGHGGRSPGTAQ